MQKSTGVATLAAPPLRCPSLTDSSECHPNHGPGFAHGVHDAKFLGVCTCRALPWVPRNADWDIRV